MCHSQEGLQIVSTLYCLSGGPGPQFFGEANHANPLQGWWSAISLRETLSPGPKPTLKTLLHSLNPPHSIIHQSNPPHLHSPQPTHRLTHPHLSNSICPLCKTHPHTTEHLFNCTHLYTSNNIVDLWMSPGRVVSLLARWKGRLAGYINLFGCRTPPQLHAGVVGRKQQQPYGKTNYKPMI